MRKGFLFDTFKCVNCRACVAACIIENKWTESSRSIYTYNADAVPGIPVTNISMACNHCETPVCVDGCPTGALYRDILSGSVLADESKCIGCRYCHWNCPYDAPKFDRKKIIIKCNLCNSLMVNGSSPACTSACPTGALKYGVLPDSSMQNSNQWLTEKNLNPAFEFTGMPVNNSPRIIPEKKFKYDSILSSNKTRVFDPEWSLLIFSFLLTMSVSTTISSLFKGIFPELFFNSFLIILAAIVSLFHPGHWGRAWRALTNLKKSPLSLEITLFILYAFTSFLSIYFLLPVLLVASSVTGIFLLISIDRVYIYSDKRKSVYMHSGQTFISALMIISFLAGTVIPFVFIAFIRLAASVTNLVSNRSAGILFGLKFCRIALLIICGTSMLSGISFQEPIILLLFLTGEFIDRLVFYLDFEPFNIRTSVNKHITIDKNEKEGS